MSAPARRGAGAAGLLLLAACASVPPSDERPANAAQLADRQAAAAAAAAQAGVDWHPLVAAPFGTLLKDSPVPLHEVLLFHDEGQAAEASPRDCYALDAGAPRFLGRVPDDYLLCFEHDRLVRIEASVGLAADDASAEFARVCALWRKDPGAELAAQGSCEGGDGAIAWSAHLALVPGEAAAISMTLTAAP